jgi:hypothetical protein
MSASRQAAEAGPSEAARGMAAAEAWSPEAARRMEAAETARGMRRRRERVCARRKHAADGDGGRRHQD